MTPSCAPSSRWRVETQREPAMRKNHDCEPECPRESLVLLEVVEAIDKPDFVLRVEIHRCAICERLHKRHRYEIDHPRLLGEGGWTQSERWIEIGDADLEFTVEEARRYGFVGDDFTWKDGRCHYRSPHREFRCSPKLLVPHLTAVSRCTRCGQYWRYLPTGWMRENERGTRLQEQRRAARRARKGRPT